MQNTHYHKIFVYICTRFQILIYKFIVMVNKKFFKLLNALSKLGLSSSSDSIKTRVPRHLIFDVLSVALDNDFTILIDEYDENKERYTITFKYLSHE